MFLKKFTNGIWNYECKEKLNILVLLVILVSSYPFNVALKLQKFTQV